MLGGAAPLGEFAGKVVLIVNVASHCGNTPQYEGLEALHERYGKDGLVVMGFPCNQFEGQEPGTARGDRRFLHRQFRRAVSDVRQDRGQRAGRRSALQMAEARHAGSDDRDVEWNFAKFLVGRDGKPVKRFGDKFMPADIAPEIEKLL